MVNSYLALGLNAAPLGMPQDVDGMSLLGVSFEIDEQVLSNLKNRLVMFEGLKSSSAHRRAGLHAA